MRKKFNLNYNWFFKEKFDESDKNLGNYEGFNQIRLPHTQKELPFNYFNWKDYQFISSYKRVLNVNKSDDKSYILKFLGIAQRSEIYLNGEFLLENKCGYNEINIDITEKIKDGDNELFVLVDSREGDFPPFGNVVDYLGYGGIYREVYLIETGQNYIQNPFFYATDLLNENKMWHLKCAFKHTTSGKIRLLVIDNKDIIIDKTFEQMDEIESQGELPDLELWDVNNPKLYKVAIELLDSNDKIQDSVTFDFGFRDIKGTKDGFYLNGKKLLLRGLDRHQAYPYVGYAMPVSGQIRDAHILRYKLGCNTMRCSHYMNHPEFLNECDKIGLLVYEEFPGWQHIGGKEWKKQALKNLDDMILRDRNHPSIAFFGVRINESPDDIPFNDACYKRAKELDPTRIITGTRAIRHSYQPDDAYAYNNFFVEYTPRVLYTKRQVTTKNKPYMITEYCGHMHPNKVYDDEERRVDAAKLHKKVISKVEKEGDLFGATGWVMADYNTHDGFGPNDMICYHGVLDMFRNEKVSSYVYQALRDNKDPFLECSSALAPGDYDSSAFKAPIIYTNCERVDCYRGDKLLATYNIKEGVDGHVFPYTDFVGNDLVEKHNESPRFQKSFKKTLKYVCLNGLDNKIGLAFHANLFQFKKIWKYGMEYLGNITKNIYTFKGYINDNLVCEKRIGYASFDHLDYSLSKESLEIGDTYDVISLTVTAKDTLGNIPRYLTDIVRVEPSEGLEMIGPKEMSLIGGNATFMFKNRHDDASNESVKVHMDRAKDTVISIPILKI